MEEEEVPVAVEEDEEASVLAAAVYHVMSATDSLSDNEDSLVEHGGIPSQSEDLPSTSVNLKPTAAPYTLASDPSPTACASPSNAPQYAAESEDPQDSGKTRNDPVNGRGYYDISNTPSLRTEPVKRGMASKPYDETLNLGDPSLEERCSEKPERET